MRKALLFLLAAFVILLVVYAKPKEGFTNLMGVNWTQTNDGTPAALYTSLPVKQPKTVALAEAGVGNIQPSPPSAADLPSAPFSQRSKETPNPYRDPSLEPAKYIRILGVKEDLQAFFGFQAPMLEDRADPSIQIPLTRARADMNELIDVQSVMERNPGLQSRITQKQLDDVQSNLRYLREILHDLETSGAIQPTALEGFEDLGATNTVAVPSSAKTDQGAPVSFSMDDGTGPRATLVQLQEFQVKVVVEIKRLEASGTSDPVIQGRLNTLNRIKDDVDQVITQYQNGSLTPDTVPIYASDIEKALPVLGNPSDPLPQLLDKTGLPPAVASLFPGGMSPKDTEQAAQINNIVQGYMKNLFEGASWGLNLMFKYDNPNVLKLKKEVADAQLAATTASPAGITTGLPGIAATAAPIVGADTSTKVATPAIANQLPTDSGYDSGLPGTSESRMLPEPKVGHLDWKTRSQQIKEQIRRRGLDPKDFGALPDDAIVSKDYSWRGYTQMMCMRLNTTLDPGLATTVGCPPQNWSGWKD
jgi:hypothetical protein